MRALIVTCLLASAFAAPQGYNYQQQTSNFQLPDLSKLTSSISSSASSSGSVAQEGHSFLQHAVQTPKVQQAFASNAGVSYNAPQQPQRLYQPVAPQQQSFGILPQNFGVPQQQQQQHHQPQQQQGYQHQQPGLVTKDIYVHVAPEEQEERYAQPQLPVAPPRKHYRIVFIKAPSQNINKAAIRLKQAPSEEKTIIYVLTKKPDPIDLQTAFEDAAPKPPSKPEVYFIKYKTQEEAQHAQRTIQAQYDQLGGTTQISDEGVAPVTSVIGSLDQPQSQPSLSSSSSSSLSSSSLSQSQSSSGYNTGLGQSSSSNSASATNSNYLPPIVRHK